MSKRNPIKRIVKSELGIAEVWNRFLSPDPFPGNLFIENGATYVCTPLGSGRMGGYRFEYGKNNSKWLILRHTKIDLENWTMTYELVDIKQSAISKLEIEIKLSLSEGGTQVVVTLNPKLSLGFSIMAFNQSRKLRKRLASISF